MTFENIDIKDMVLIGGGLFTVAIIVHGLWISWRSRREPLRLAITPGLLPEDDDELAEYGSELPNGGGRVANPMQKDLDFDKEVPVLLDPVGTPKAAPDSPATPVERPVEPVREAPGTTGGQHTPTYARASSAEYPETSKAPGRDSWRSQSGARAVAESPEEPKGEPAEEAEANYEELLVINLFAANGTEFTGEALLAAMRAQGLRYGEMSIFQCLEPGTGEIRFSVANVLEPGYFDLAEISNFSSPGLVFFLRLPGPQNPGDALEAMIRITQAIAEKLGAVLKDENMSVFTGQTMEHYRERVADFSRRRLSQRA